MADIRKDQEREELHRAIWAIADGLRGSVDGWDFKSYVLGMMFYRYISENLTTILTRARLKPETMALIMPCCLTKTQSRLVRIWSRQKVSSFSRLSFSAISEKLRQVTRILI